MAGRDGCRHSVRNPPALAHAATERAADSSLTPEDVGDAFADEESGQSGSDQGDLGWWAAQGLNL
jgi:hypothetical protein